MKKEMNYSYDLYDNRTNRIEGKQISEKNYKEVIAKFKPFREWDTEYKDYILYAKLFKVNDYNLFLWKEVSK